jgi:formylmethanofuran dehydrogenase subunit A
MSDAATETLVLRGGRIHDPANGVDGSLGDLWIREGRIVEPQSHGTREIDLDGLVVMPGGIDLHSHVAGPKVSLGRRMQLPPAGGPAAVPTIHATGRLYAALGYTIVFDAAIATAAAPLAHLELADLPILDHGIYVLAADDDDVIAACDRGHDDELTRLLGDRVRDSRAWAVKIANPGGSRCWKAGRRGDHRDLDDLLPGSNLSGRRMLQRLATTIERLGLPHPLHVHTINLGLPGNWRSTLETMQSLDGLRAHLAHVQFHSYLGGDADETSFGSGVEPLVTWFNEHPTLSIDVGQVLFGSTVAMTGDPLAAEHLAAVTGVPWSAHDLHLEGGCGVMPIRYRERSLIHAWQWAVGLEWFLTAADPWRLVLSTDHPNGAHFTAYPTLMRLLGDAAFRREAFARIHPVVRRRSPLASLDREYSLNELAIITRAAPARLAGLPSKGHLGVGADADIAVYRPDPDLARMFAMPKQVYKAGVLVAEDGHLRQSIAGRTLAAEI